MDYHNNKNSDNFIINNKHNHNTEEQKQYTNLILHSY